MGCTALAEINILSPDCDILGEGRAVSNTLATIIW